MAQGDRPPGRAQPRFAGRIEPGQHLRRGQLRQHPADRLVELDQARFDQLHRRERGHRLGHRGDAKDRVRGHGTALGEIALPERALVENPVRGRRQGHDPRHLAGLGGMAQQRVDFGD